MTEDGNGADGRGTGPGDSDADGDGEGTPISLVVPLLDKRDVDPAVLVSVWDARDEVDSYADFPVRLSKFTDDESNAGHIYRAK